VLLTDTYAYCLTSGSKIIDFININKVTLIIECYVKTFKIAATCFDPKIIIRELHCSLLKSHY